MSKSKIFFWLSLSFIAGVMTASFYYPREIKTFHFLFLLVLVLIYFFTFYKNKKSFIIFFGALFFILGIFLTNTSLEKIRTSELDGQEFSGEVKIVKEPEIKGLRQKMIVSPREKSVRFLINIYDLSEYSYGDKLQLGCLLKIPENFSEDFDYRMYLAKDNILYQCQNPRIKKINEKKNQSVFNLLLKVKDEFNSQIERLIPAPESGLLSGLLLGGDDKLSEEWQEKFSLTGMTHIVAVSGYNVAIIAEYLMIFGIALGLWRKQAFWLAVTGIIIFVLMIGLPSSAVRAGIMGILLIWAIKNGRLANAQNAIIFSAVLMLLINPLLLRWDVGFQLSFLATLGIVYFYPLFNEYLVKKNKAFGLTEILFLTLSAQLFVLPIILFNFQRLSLISPLANILVLPIIPLAMLLGFLAALLGFFLRPIALFFAWLAFLILKYETLTIDFLSKLKYASLEVSLTWWGVVFWYIILGGVIFYFNSYGQKKNNL